MMNNLHKADPRESKMEKQTSVQSRVDLMVGRSDGSTLQDDLVIPEERMQRTNVRRGRQSERKGGERKNRTHKRRMKSSLEESERKEK